MVIRHGRPYDPAWDRWRPVRRWPGILAACVVTIGLCVSIGYLLEKPSKSVTVHSQLHVSINDFVVPAYFPPVAQDTEHVEAYSGTTSQYHLSLVSPGGLTQWNFTCQCQNNFDVQVFDSTGALIDIPLNVIGRTHLAALANYPAGQYYFDVQADGPWTIDFVPEGGLPIITGDYRYFSHGTSVLGPFSPSDNYLSTGYVADLGQLMTIQVVDKNDDVAQTPIFQISTFTKNLVLTDLPDPYYLIVQGVGDWVINLSPATARN